MDNSWELFFQNYVNTVKSEQLPVKLPRFDLELSELAGAAADWCNQYLKDRQCPMDLIVRLTQKVINELRVPWTVQPEEFGYRSEKKDYQSLWLMQQVIKKLNDVCLNDGSIIIEKHPRLNSSIWWSSFVLKNTRRTMEDYISVVPYLHTLFDQENSIGEASFYAVYDGHNGHDAAVYSSIYLYQFLVQSKYYPSDPEHAFFDAFNTTDKMFSCKTDKYNLVSGTTAVCVLHRLQEKKIYIAWVGDSLATLWKNSTPLSLVNKHVPQRHDEAQRIATEGGIVIDCQGIYRVDGQLSVSRAIGDVRYKPYISAVPEMRCLVLDGNEEFLVLGSDGLWDHVDIDDIADTLYEELMETDGDPTGVCNKLAFKAKAQGSKDNISVITVFLQDPKQLVARRKADIMETAMEQRNSLSSSYGQDTSGFGPETDVDTPDEPIGHSKPKVVADEGEVNESGEDSEDGGGWNYYTNGNGQRYSENDHNNEADEMDRKLNPDAPEFVPVASPPTHFDNHLQRFLDTANDDFISSSPQKFRETIENVDLPDENDFACDVKAADLSKLDNAYETKGEFDLINGVKPLDNELNGGHHEHENIKRDIATELFGSDMIGNNENNFVTTNGDDFDDFRRIPDDQQNDGPLDLNRARNLFDGVVDNVDPYTSLIETVSKQEDFNPFIAEKVEEELNASFTENSLNSVEFKVNGSGCDDALECKNESVDTFNKSEVNGTDDLVALQPDEENVNSTNIFDSQIPDDSISTANATLGSIVPQLDESDVTTTNVYDGDSTINVGGYEDRKLDDSISTTDAMMGSEPNTPMRMVNQSTFESDNSGDEGVDQAVVDSWKDSTVYENKENDDPYCMDQTAVEDPEGIIPQVTAKKVPIEEELHQIVEDKIELVQTGEKLPVEELTCLKTTAAKIENSFYEQQDLPESDFTSSTHEALMNAAVHNLTKDIPEVDSSIQHSYTQEQECEDSDVDEVKCHAESLNKFQYENEPVHDKSDGFKFEKNNSVYNEFEDNQDHNNFESTPIYSENFKDQYHHNDFESNQNHSDDINNINHDASEPAQNHYDNLIEQKHNDNFEKNEVDQSHLNHRLVDNFEAEQFVQSKEVLQEHDNREVDSDEEMNSSMIIHSDVESNPPQPYCSEVNTMAVDPDMMSQSMTFEENFQNRSMSDSLYVMETSSDYFGDLQKSTTHHEESRKPEEQVESSVTKEPELVVPESNPEVINESFKSEEIQPELFQASKDTVPEPKADEQKESSNVSGVAITAAAAGAVVAAVATGAVTIATKKSPSSTAVKKPESAAKTKTATTKVPPKLLASKSSAAAPIKKTTAATKPKTATSTSFSSRPISAPSRPTTTSRISTTLKSTTATTTKTATKPAVSKTSVTTPRPTSAAPKTPTTPRTSTTLKTSITPKTPTSPRTATTATLKTTPTLKSTTTFRTSLASKQTLTNGTAKPPSRPISAALKKPLTNGTTKLTNGDTSKPALSKGPVNLATRTSLAPPKLPPKAKTTPKTTVAPPSMPGPIRRPTASAPKKTETASS
ncbi:uncharacterized protein LOC126895345 isoform X2 [Daktulosphaira vitifoliae]|uniref:uncharacterized protein LOC126895345 isoform X2 n=1 Tax=Daktulosphaira vitifoliae TaxID=58002 RepID=UPI0021A97805|nr:uncharacterized protein LOC126895345 isoform X2 [Daktulosphaira vitifoliae]